MVEHSGVGGDLTYHLIQGITYVCTKYLSRMDGPLSQNNDFKLHKIKVIGLPRKPITVKDSAQNTLKDKSVI